MVGAEVLSPFSQAGTLKEIDISDIIAGRPEKEAIEVFQTLCAALGSSKPTKIDLSDNALGIKGINACEALLKNQPQLETFLICNNGMSGDSATLIVDVLLCGGNSTNLKLFHFHNNMGGDESGHAIARLISASPDLVDVRFSTTRCQRQGMVALSNALASLKNITRCRLLFPRLVRHFIPTKGTAAFAFAHVLHALLSGLPSLCPSSFPGSRSIQLFAS